MCHQRAITYPPTEADREFSAQTGLIVLRRGIPAACLLLICLPPPPHPPTKVMLCYVTNLLEQVGDPSLRIPFLPLLFLRIHTKAQAARRKAIRLSRLQQQAIKQVQCGDYGRALPILMHVRDVCEGAASPKIMYTIACCYAHLGSKGKALQGAPCPPT